MLVAEDAVRQQQLPLLGISSSVPRFKQGPVTIWIEMVISAVAGHRLFVFSLVFALISVTAVLAVYELSAVYISRRTALISSLILAVSPLAVAHGRMPYHITPIPLMTVLYLWTLTRLWHQKRSALFWSVLAWCLLFQFELALLPALLLIPYVLWRTKAVPSKRHVLESLAALGLGLLPQIVYDLTHGFTQLGGFAIWVLYRIASALGLVGSYMVSPSTLSSAASAFWLYGGRVLTLEGPEIKILWFLLLLISAIAVVRSGRLRKLPPVVEIISALTVILSLGFVIHSAPSEAYFPPFLVLLPLILGYGISQIRRQTQAGLLLLITTLSLGNIWQIWQHQFFVSNTQVMTYGPSLTEQRQAVALIDRLSRSNFQYLTTQTGGVFPNYFDNLRWLAQEQGVEENQVDGEMFYVEGKDSSLSGYPASTKYYLPSIDIYHLSL